jgi:hypothetical protein
VYLCAANVWGLFTISSRAQRYAGQVTNAMLAWAFRHASHHVVEIDFGSALQFLHVLLDNLTDNQHYLAVMFVDD